MDRKRLAATGVFTIAAAGLVAVGIAVSNGAPGDQPDTQPAGQVEQVEAPVPPSSTTTTAPPAAPVDTPADSAPAPAEGGDTGVMNQPAPADEPPDIAPGNPAGDFEQRPAPPPAAPPTVALPVEDPPESPTPEPAP